MVNKEWVRNQKLHPLKGGVFIKFVNIFAITQVLLAISEGLLTVLIWYGISYNAIRLKNWNF